MSHTIRQAVPEDLPRLAHIWHDGWHESHAAHVPENLTAQRTLESFAQRLGAMLDATNVVGPIGDPEGFCTIKTDELYQIFVSPKARGTGVATSLLKDGQMRIAARGFERAWLSCAIGNTRAAHFYEREGWIHTGDITYDAETASGLFSLKVWKYEKHLA